MPWNFGDILDAIEPVLPPDAPALIHGARTITWAQLSRRSNNLARALVEGGARPGDKVAFYMRNRPEYLETLSAAFKARLTHINVNYRYTADEVFYIFDNSDAQTVVYGVEFRDIIAQIQPRLTKVRTFIEITDGGHAAPFAIDYEALAEVGDGSPLAIERSPDDMLFIYTGGTTGMPKGVMWTHGDMREITLQAARRMGPVPESPAELAAAIRQAGPGARLLPAPPLMHGTGLLTGMGAILAGGCVITLESPSFDAIELLEAVDKHKPQSLVIVGDSFAKPILNALNDAPGKYDVSSVAVIVSSGVMWSLEVKRGLLEHMPQAMLNDGFSSSEALGMGASVMTKAGEVQTAKFMIGERCRMFDENDQPVEAGSGTPGIVALGPPNPLGYYKDDEKTARTFRTIGGVRYSIPGDWCVVETDGSLTLLGRGNACINTAGEKVFPEEVEEALKTHPSVEDCLVIGLPDEKWGQSVTAVVRLAPNQALDEDLLRRHVRERLAGYKTPKRVLTGEVSLRAPNGKANYKAASEFARELLGVAG
ncbi:MAG TPA: acyl-CoA synthetase [Caulobacteraceae bacterium]|nr:acyl-CoA synthetase [Caulobacteraceae bacterium]